MDSKMKPLFLYCVVNIWFFLTKCQSDILASGAVSAETVFAAFVAVL